MIALISQIQYDNLDTGDTPEKIIVYENLKQSIADYGLINPILVRRIEEGYRLIAGKKRLKAFIELGEKEIEICETQNPHDLELRLQENLRRDNLPWYEQVTMEHEFHELRQAMFGKNKAGRKKQGTEVLGWNLRDTAEALGRSMGLMSQDMQLAVALKSNPSLAKVKDKKTALKLVHQTVQREEAIIDCLMDLTDFKFDQVLLGDSLDILPLVPANLFDVCITDPPWTEYARDQALTKDSSTVAVFKEIYRTLKHDSLLYAIVSTGDFEMYKSQLPKLGFTVQQYPLVWHKTGTITHGRRGWEYARDYEPILLAAKGSPVLSTTTEQSSILKFPSLHYTKMIHPHEKPIELISHIIMQCTHDNSKVLDPFCGSGVVLEAARKLGRPFFGIERNQDFYEKILRRLGK